MNSIKLKVQKEIYLKKFLCYNHISKRSYNNILNSHLVKVNNKFIDSNIRLKKEDIVEIYIEEEKLDYKPLAKKIKILYEDDDIIAIEKPYRITVNSKNQVNLSNYIAYYFREHEIKSKIRLINRLDMNTSGLMLVAKNKYAQAYYQGEMENNRLDKYYLAIVEGNLKINRLINLPLVYDKDNKKMKYNLDGKIASTYFKTISAYEKFSLIECKIITGKTHQIRISLSHLGYPILGDILYGSRYEMDRFFLHSYKIKFVKFMDNKKITILSRPNFDGDLNLNIWYY